MNEEHTPGEFEKNMEKERPDQPSTRTGTKQQPAKREPGQLPPWKVLLHNDDVNVVEEVIQHVYQLTPLDEQRATQCVKEAHESGLSLLLVTHQERAELYVDQFASFKLTVTIEPDG